MDRIQAGKPEEAVEGEKRMTVLIHNEGDGVAKLYLEKLNEHVEVPSQWWLILMFEDGEIVDYDISQAKPEEV
jgi:hypothetical protein